MLIINEVEKINSEYFGKFSHSTRRVYHSILKHCFKNVILVSVKNIVRIINNNASLFNITVNLNIPYFTSKEVQELFSLHENAKKIKEKTNF